MNEPMSGAASPVFKSNAVIIERGLIGIQTSAIRLCYAYEQRREIQDLSKLPFALPDLLFRMFALGNVNNGTHKFNEIAGWAQNRMAYHVDVSDLAAGMNDPVIQLELRLLAPCCLGYFPELGLIFRMDALKKCFESRFFTMRVKTQQSVAFFGPVLELAGGGEKCPTARVAQSLCF